MTAMPPLPLHDGSPGRARELPPPREIGAPLSASGRSESVATSDGRTSGVFVGIVLGAIAGGATLFGGNYVIRHAMYPERGPLSGDWVYESAILAGVVAVAIIAFFAYRGFTTRHPGSIEWVGTDGVAEVDLLDGRAAQMRIVRFADVAGVRLDLVRHGKAGRYLRKTWSFVDAHGRARHVIVGEGDMDPWSPDPARATGRDKGWTYGAAAVAAYERFRNARGAR